MNNWKDINGEYDLTYIGPSDGSRNILDKPQRVHVEYADDQPAQGVKVLVDGKPMRASEVKAGFDPPLTGKVQPDRIDIYYDDGKNVINGDRAPGSN